MVMGGDTLVYFFTLVFLLWTSTLPDPLPNRMGCKSRIYVGP